MAISRDDINLRGVVMTSLALVVVAIVVQVAMWLLFDYFAVREAAKTPHLYPLASTETRLPPQPRVQANPAEDMKALRLESEAMLTSYAWVNEKAGIVRIPIDRAMILVAERGLPVRSGAQAEIPTR